MLTSFLKSKYSISGDEVFRVLSPFLYASAVLQAGFAWSKPNAAQLGASALLALLLLLALRRLFSSPVAHFTPSHSLIECCATLVAVSALAWPQARMAFPWLVMCACLFPLILSGKLMLGVAAAIGLTGLALNLFTGASASDSLSQFSVILLAGALAILLSEVLRFHLVATGTAHVDLARFRKLSEQKLDEERVLLRAVLDHNPLMIYATDLQGCFTISNHSFQQRFGFLSEDDLRGKTNHDVMLMQPANMQKHIARQLAHESRLHDGKIMQSGEPAQSIEIASLWENETPRWYKYNKYPLRDSQGQTIGILNTMRDITHRKENEIHLKYQSLHDPLTGLANRRYMLQSIAEGIDLSHATGDSFAVLFCNLDFFKNVNDIHGHEFGDKCLREITRRIRAQLDNTDFAARFGSDEFVILVKATLTDAAAKAQVLLQALSLPLIVNDVVVKVGVSIGIAQMRDDHERPSDLIRDADAAMYQAKGLGRNRIEIFDATLREISTRRAQLDCALHFALENNEFSILYQPKVSMQDRSLKGLELLLRWNSPQYGEVSPTEFIPIAESNGLIVPIGLWVLEQACKQQRQWQTAFPQAAGVTVAVNVSMRQLLQAAFLPAVTRILEESGVIPDSIELELTETSVMASPLKVIENLTRLKQLGLRLALDDFGTGYSSLAYLQKLPINTLKIDKAFVLGIAKRKSENEIVRLIITLARTLTLDIIAEGVETQEQVAALTRLGCEIGQGFLFSPPISAQEVEKWLVVPEHPPEHRLEHRRPDITPDPVRTD